MNRIATIDELETLYGAASDAALRKVTTRLNEPYRRMLEASPFVAVATGTGDGFDCSPRGDRNQVAFVLDERSIAIPDRRGNNRLDTLRNIVADGRIALLFLLPGRDECLRVNGTAFLTTDLNERFAVDGKAPASVIVVEIAKVYFQCARAIMRSGLWNGPVAKDLPTPGEMIKAAFADFDAETYERERPARQEETLY